MGSKPPLHSYQRSQFDSKYSRLVGRSSSLSENIPDSFVLLKQKLVLQPCSFYSSQSSTALKVASYHLFVAYQYVTQGLLYWEQIKVSSLITQQTCSLKSCLIARPLCMIYGPSSPFKEEEKPEKNAKCVF